MAPFGGKNGLKRIVAAYERFEKTKFKPPVASWLGCQNMCISGIVCLNKTRQGYARKRILKPAGYFFVRPKLAARKRVEGAQ